MLRRGPRAGIGDVFLGIVRLAIGRKDGLRHFGSSKDRFLASLAPLIAFPLVAAVLLGASGKAELAGAQFLGALCALLAPLVVSYEFARLWRRTELWLRFGTAFNWCQWAIPIVALIVLSVVAPGLEQEIGARAALEAGLGLTAAYALWLHWFIARQGLELSVMRAILLVVAVNLASAVVGVGPVLLAQRGL